MYREILGILARTSIVEILAAEPPRMCKRRPVFVPAIGGEIGAAAVLIIADPIFPFAAGAGSDGLAISVLLGILQASGVVIGGDHAGSAVGAANSLLNRNLGDFFCFAIRTIAGASPQRSGFLGNSSDGRLHTGTILQRGYTDG